MSPFITRMWSFNTMLPLYAVSIAHSLTLTPSRPYSPVSFSVG